MTGFAKVVSSVSVLGSSKHSNQVRATAHATMPTPKDRHEINLETSHYEDVAELEDNILCFLPTVSDLEVFGCELELLNLHTQQPLPEAFRTVLLQRPQLQIVVRPCMTLRLAVPG